MKQPNHLPFELGNVNGTPDDICYCGMYWPGEPANSTTSGFANSSELLHLRGCSFVTHCSPVLNPRQLQSPAPTEMCLYQDVFTNPGTGWAAAEFDNYFIGYHEPEYYHVEIKSPHLKAPVVGIPDAETHNFRMQPSNCRSILCLEEPQRTAIIVMVWCSVARVTTIMPSPSLRPPRNGRCSKALPAGSCL